KLRSPPSFANDLSMNDDFFSILGHLAQRRHREDQLSNTFRACFTCSKAFRQTLVQQLLKLCGLPHRLAEAEGWECETQVTKVTGRTKPDRSRYDIVIELADRGKA